MNNFIMIDEVDVKKIRALLGISQKELAEKLGISTRTVANYEAGGVIPMNKKILIDNLLKSHSFSSKSDSFHKISNSVIGENNYTAYTNDKSGSDSHISELLRLKDEMIEKLSFQIEQKDRMIESLNERLAEKDKLISMIITNSKKN